MSSRSGDSGAILANLFLGDWSAGWSEASRAAGWQGCIKCNCDGDMQDSALEVQALVVVSASSFILIIKLDLIFQLAAGRGEPATNLCSDMD